MRRREAIERPNDRQSAREKRPAVQPQPEHPPSP